MHSPACRSTPRAREQSRQERPHTFDLRTARV